MIDGTMGGELLLPMQKGVNGGQHKMDGGGVIAMVGSSDNWQQWRNIWRDGKIIATGNWRLIPHSTRYE